MNFCTKCGSYYQNPGTCNCYAAGRAEITPVIPITPTVPFYPTYPDTTPWVRPWWEQTWPYGTFCDTETESGDSIRFHVTAGNEQCTPTVIGD